MSGLTPPNILSYTGQIAVPSINRTFPPTTSFNDFNVPTIWTDTLHENAYILVSKALGVAEWIMLGGAPGALDTITTPDATVVVPSAGNINFLNGTGISITGSGNDITFSPGTFTVTAGTGLATGGTANLNSAVTLALSTPVTVAHGGTGDTSLTAYAVLCGGTTSTNPIQSIASVGTSGQVLTSNGAGALPSMQNGSQAGKQLVLATLSNAVANATGDGTDYTIVYDTAPVNTGTAYNVATGVFTAPGTATYLISGAICINNLTAAHATGFTVISTTPLALTADRGNYGAMRAVSGGGAYSASFCGYASLTVGQTISITIVVAGSTKTITIEGSGSTQAFNYMSICQIA
jgi:hypothetical protein